jgi:site-specific recombinase XerD
MSNERPTEWLDEGEVRRLLDTPDRRTLKGKRDLAVLLVLAEGGLREGEVCALRVEDLKQIQGRSCLHFETLKKRSGRVVMRVVPLSERTEAAIRAYWAQLPRYGTTPPHEASMFLTLGERGPYVRGPLTPKAVDGLVASAVQKAGISKRITPHSLRHTCATLALQHAADLATVRDLLGHCAIATTALYLHSSLERKTAAVDALAKAWGGKSSYSTPTHESSPQNPSGYPKANQSEPRRSPDSANGSEFRGSSDAGSVRPIPRGPLPLPQKRSEVIS